MGWLSKTIDTAVTAVSPQAGLRRSRARLRMEITEAQAIGIRRNLSSGGYASAERSRDSHSWLTSRLSPQSAIESDRPEMLRRADAVYKNHELGANHVEGRTIRVVGCGTRLDPNIAPGNGVTELRADEWNDRLRADWMRQTERIGRGDKPLWKVQQVLHRHYERHGEFFLLIGDRFDPLSPTTIKVEVIHPSRVETPPGKEGDPLCRMGVQLDSSGEVVGYHIREAHPGDDKELHSERFTYRTANFPNGLPQVVHHFDETEAGQRRGFPRMQVGQRRLKNVDEYSEAEIERNYMGACNVATVRTDLDESEIRSGEVLDSSGRLVKEFTPGMYNYIGASDSVEYSNPSGAPQTYGEFCRVQGKYWAAGAGTPYPIAAYDFEGMNYSTLRVVWNIEDATCAVLHKGQAEAVKAIYRNFVARTVAFGDSLPGLTQAAFRAEPWRYWAARIVPPAKASIDPAREDRNDLTLVEAGVKPASDIVERKNDGELASTVYRRVAQDRRNRREEGIEEHMPNMGRDPKPASPVSSTQAGDPNPAASAPNEAGARE